MVTFANGLFKLPVICIGFCCCYASLHRAWGAACESSSTKKHDLSSYWANRKLCLVSDSSPALCMCVEVGGSRWASLARLPEVVGIWGRTELTRDNLQMIQRAQLHKCRCTGVTFIIDTHCHCPVSTSDHQEHLHVLCALRTFHRFTLLHVIVNHFTDT